MSHFRYQGQQKECSNCKYFRLKKLHNRCLHKDNLTRNNIGIVYMARPEHKNWDGKCKEYEERHASSKHIKREK
ncbi:MAG: hypothetical protein ACXABY_29680 [Candidatus Thorarchaeota archaeon]